MVVLISNKLLYSLLAGLMILSISIVVWAQSSGVSHSATEIVGLQADLDAFDTRLDSLESKEFVKVGEYTGNGSASRTITISETAGRTPKMIWVVRETFPMPYYRIDNGPLYDECNDNTERWCVVASPGDNLRAVSGGFMVVNTGDIHSTNTNGLEYNYIVYF
ncbi:MAG: hypothetical protein ABIE22_02610 [archaeon]